MANLHAQLKLMTSWAVVCDVHFLPPQTRREDETAQQFAERCQVLAPDAQKRETDSESLCFPFVSWPSTLHRRASICAVRSLASATTRF